ncbi:MFS transporter, SP family, sugar:H+ symporter, partial [Tremellales sp. Uapishka_1]
MIVAASSGNESGGLWTFFKKENRRALLFCLLMTSGPILYGYDGTLLAETAFKRDYGYLVSGAGATATYAYTSTNQSLWTSIIQVGEVFGSLSAGFVGDKGGRKGAALVAIILVTIGVVIQMVKNISALLTVGRLIIGLGIGMISNTVPLYLSEIPPAHLRGVAVSSWQLMLAIGQVIGACVGYGAETLDNKAAYLIPMGINLVFVLLIGVALLIVPESPRWLLYRGREDKAVRALERIHGGTEMKEILVQEQLAILNKSREEELAATEGAASKWSDLLFNKVERRKAICVIGILVSQQISGVQFIFSYTTTFFQLVGIDDAFTITIVVDCLEVFGVLCSFLIVNRFGRRPLLLWSAVFMMITLLMVGVLGAVAGHGDFSDYLADHKALGQAIAAMICLYVWAFNLVWGPLAWAVASEMSTGRNRQKSMSIGTACFWVVAWATTFTLPYLFNKEEAGLGPMIGFIYAFGALLSILFVYFCIPETSGRTLEEINFMFEAGIPTREWARYDLATVVAKDEKKGMRFAGTTEHFEGEKAMPLKRSDSLTA